jgi:hypothetical protein
MTTNADDLVQRLRAYRRDERHRTKSEVVYWLEQYKALASDTIERLLLVDQNDSSN